MIRMFCVFFPSLALAFYLWLGEPQSMVKFGGFVQGITLPVISGAALYLRYTRTDPRIAPNKLTDLCLWVAFGLMLLFGVKALWDKAMPAAAPKPAAAQVETK